MSSLVMLRCPSCACSDISELSQVSVKGLSVAVNIDGETIWADRDIYDDFEQTGHFYCEGCHEEFYLTLEELQQIWQKGQT